MKRLFVLLLLIVAIARGQDNWAAVGVTYNRGATPAIAGTGLYARRTGPTFMFTVVDCLPTTYKPFTVVTQFSMGVAQRLFGVGKVDFFVPTSAGLSVDGTSTGWMWSTGALASIQIGGGSWRIYPGVRVSKASIANTYQVFGGVLIGWGW